MKPQCTTAAQCLEELARVMEQFGIEAPIEAAASKYVKYDNRTVERTTYMPVFSSPVRWQFAIAEVEGKPVFVNDDLYDLAGNRFTVEWFDDGVLYGVYPCASSASVNLKACSWKPPRPKTVMVELTVEDAEFFMSEMEYHNEAINVGSRMYAACRKALEEMK